MNAEWLRDFCMSLPSAQEDIKWGKDLCFLIGEKMFCVTGLEGPFGASFKVRESEFDEMSARPGIIPAPYVARYHWVAVQLPTALTQEEWEHYIRQSYDLIRSKLPAKIRSQLKDQ